MSTLQNIIGAFAKFNRITVKDNPINAADAVNKDYADSVIIEAADSSDPRTVVPADKGKIITAQFALNFIFPDSLGAGFHCQILNIDSAVTNFTWSKKAGDDLVFIDLSVGAASKSKAAGALVNFLMYEDDTATDLFCTVSGDTQAVS